MYSFPPATTSCNDILLDFSHHKHIRWAPDTSDLAWKMRTSPNIVTSERPRNTRATSHGSAEPYLSYHNYIRWAPDTSDLAWSTKLSLSKTGLLGSAQRCRGPYLSFPVEVTSASIEHRLKLGRL